MNTDNMAISGETIDYGPCAFMNAYDPATVFSSIDHGGRYAYGNQPNIAQWNLARFAETLLPLLDPDQEKAVAARDGGAERIPRPVRAVLARRHAEEAGASDGGSRRRRIDPGRCSTGCRRPGPISPTRSATCRRKGRRPATAIRTRISRHGTPVAGAARPTTASAAAYAVMRTVNPAVIPRNHRVEEALAAAEERDDLSVLHRLLEVLASPYEEGRRWLSTRTRPPTMAAIGRSAGRSRSRHLPTLT